MKFYNIVSDPLKFWAGGHKSHKIYSFYISFLLSTRINKQRLQDEQNLDELDLGEQSWHEPGQGMQHQGEQLQGVQLQGVQLQEMPVQLASSSYHSQKPCTQPHKQSHQEHKGMLH